MSTDKHVLLPFTRRVQTDSKVSLDDILTDRRSTNVVGQLSTRPISTRRHSPLCMSLQSRRKRSISAVPRRHASGVSSESIQVHLIRPDPTGTADTLCSGPGSGSLTTPGSPSADPLAVPGLPVLDPQLALFLQQLTAIVNSVVLNANSTPALTQPKPDSHGSVSPQAATSTSTGNVRDQDKLIPPEPSSASPITSGDSSLFDSFPRLSHAAILDIVRFEFSASDLSKLHAAYGSVASTPFTSSPTENLGDFPTLIHLLPSISVYFEILGAHAASSVNASAVTAFAIQRASLSHIRTLLKLSA
ncbi:hypothetical protein CVT24_002437, partial [Panaeolus cyanescens]